MNFLNSDIFMHYYFTAWLIILTIAVFVSIKNKSSHEIYHRNYWQFLFEPWKITTFLIATFFITSAAPYSGDPTWDYADSIIISVLTYVLAPWTVGAIYRSFKFKQLNSKLFTAIVYFFIPCWVYDAYIFIKDGYYPITWFTNVIISSGIVLTAGLYWNLRNTEKGTDFAVRDPDWPERTHSSVKKMMVPMLILMFPVVYATAWFVYNYFW